jgi:uncharacterized protein GlcG (DUF336 family)
MAETARTVGRRMLTVDTARRMLDAGLGAAEPTGKRFSIAIVDDAGVLKAFARMDGASLVSVQVAEDKAYTAGASGRASHQWDEMLESDPPLGRGVPTGIRRLVTFGGGYPIRLDGELVGGIGVSGAHYSEDMQIAQAALAAVGAPY